MAAKEDQNHELEELGSSSDFLFRMGREKQDSLLCSDGPRHWCVLALLFDTDTTKSTVDALDELLMHFVR